MAEREALTAAYLRSILHYNPETGTFIWKERPREHFSSKRGHAVWNGRYSGTIAGRTDDRGYRFICVNWKPYTAHRLAWLYMTGEWPTSGLDHVNLDKGDNRFSNLREATQSQNNANTRAPSTNTSGVKGVYWHRKAEKWLAQIKVNGSVHYLGLFNDIDEAAAAYERAADKHFGEFARAA